MVLSSVTDVLIASILATLGWLMVPLPLLVVCSVVAGAIIFALIVDLVKVAVFSRLEIA